MLKTMFYLFIFTIPYFGVSPLQKIGAIPVGAIMVALFLLLFGLFVLRNGLPQTCRKLLSVPQAKLFVLFWVVNFLSLILADFRGLIPAINHENLIELGYLSFAVLVCLLVANMVDNKEELKTISRMRIWAGTLASAIAIFLLFGALMGWGWGRATPWTVPRLVGTVAEPQVFGNYLLSVLPLIFAVLMYPNTVFHGPPIFIYAYVGLTALVMTYSLGAWVGFAGGFGFLVFFLCKVYRKFWVWGPWGKTLAVALAVTVTLTAVNFTVYPNYLEGFVSIAYKITGKVPDFSKVQATAGQGKVKKDEIDQDTATLALQTDNFTPGSPKAKYTESIRSKAERAWFRAAAWEMFKEYPLFGVGIGNFGRIYNQFKPPGTESFPFSVKAHNQFMEVLAETGIVGFIIFLTFLGKVFYLAYQAIVYFRADGKVLTIGLAVSLFAVIIQGYSYGFMVHIYFWVLSGMILGASQLIPAGGKTGS